MGGKKDVGRRKAQLGKLPRDTKKQHEGDTLTEARLGGHILARKGDNGSGPASPV